MCGFAGLVGEWGSQQKQGVAMASLRLAHRGPDADGFWEDTLCLLSHRRLKILDLADSANQPMQDQASGLVMVFNGEIFNHRELRQLLEDKGHAFFGHSDTEVLLRGFKEWGPSLTPKLEGMFAFAVWDPRARRLYAAVDRLAKKPFFFHEKLGRLHFASEFDALVAALPQRPGFSADSFARYAAFGYLWGHRTVLEGIQRLGPGRELFWEDGRIALSNYPAVNPEKAEQIPPPHILESRLKELLESAVERRMVSDVPLGCLLSGGVDSTLITALAAKKTGASRLQSFTAAFPGSCRDESSEASAVAKFLGTRHRTLPVSESQMLEDFLGILRRASEPLADDSFLPSSLISQRARQDVTVALSGDGGDELFLGYSKYRQLEMANLAGFVHPFWRLARFFACPDAAAKAADLFSQPTEARRALWLASLWKPDELPGILAEPKLATGVEEEFSARWAAVSAVDPQARFSAVDLQTYLPGDILTKVDRASMAASLEVRSPLLDERVVSAVLAWRQQNPAPFQRKRLLKKILARLVPPELWERPKQGFSPPLDEWYRGALRPILIEYTRPERLSQGGLWNPEGVARFRDQHLGGRRNFGRKLHAVVAFEIWREGQSFH